MGSLFQAAPAEGEAHAESEAPAEGEAPVRKRPDFARTKQLPDGRGSVRPDAFPHTL